MPQDSPPDRLGRRLVHAEPFPRGAYPTAHARYMPGRPTAAPRPPGGTARQPPPGSCPGRAEPRAAHPATGGGVSGSSRCGTRRKPGLSAPLDAPPSIRPKGRNVGCIGAGRSALRARPPCGSRHPSFPRGLRVPSPRARARVPTPGLIWAAAATAATLHVWRLQALTGAAQHAVEPLRAGTARRECGRPPPKGTGAAPRR